MITLKPPFRAQDMEGLFNKVCKGQYSRIPDRFSDDLFQVIQFLLQVNSSSRPSCEQILNHPAVMKRIEYFKSFAKEDETEDRFLLKTIHMPKNLLFLSDKLPKPNYEKQFKSTNNPIEDNNNKNYRSFNKDNNNNRNNSNNKIDNNINGENIKKPLKLVPLSNINEEKEKLNSIQNINAMNRENNKQSIIQGNSASNKNLRGNIISPSNIIINQKMNNGNKIKLNKNKNYYIDLLSKQKNDLIIRNNNRRINYVNNNSLNNGSIKDINNIIMSKMINKSVPKKINNYKLINNKYYIQNAPQHIKNIKYQKNISSLDYNIYDIGKNYSNRNDFIPRIPRRLMPIKKPTSNIL
jgi:NIMA (never in mitosis gene a)-related kinase